MPTRAKQHHRALINVASGVLSIVIFGLFMINGYPPPKSIIPPVGVAVGIGFLVIGIVGYEKQRRTTRRALD